jgi:hypothetical protein
MRDKKVSLGWSRTTDQVYATIKSQEGRKLGDPINITPEFLGAMVEYLRNRGGSVSINERVQVNKEFDSASPLKSGVKAEVKVKMAGIVNRRIRIQIVEDVLVEAEPKETPAGKDGGV